MSNGRSIPTAFLSLQADAVRACGYSGNQDKRSVCEQSILLAVQGWPVALCDCGADHHGAHRRAIAGMRQTIARQIYEERKTGCAGLFAFIGLMILKAMVSAVVADALEWLVSRYLADPAFAWRVKGLVSIMGTGGDLSPPDDDGGRGHGRPSIIG